MSLLNSLEMRTEEVCRSVLALVRPAPLPLCNFLSRLRVFHISDVHLFENQYLI